MRTQSPELNIKIKLGKDFYFCKRKKGKKEKENSPSLFKSVKDTREINNTHMACRQKKCSRK